MSRHLYMSTACWHAVHTDDPEQAERLHAYCGSDRGAHGTKTPGECKWCDAVCVCLVCQHEPP